MPMESDYIYKPVRHIEINLTRILGEVLYIWDSYSNVLLLNIYIIALAIHE